MPRRCSMMPVMPTPGRSFSTSSIAMRRAWSGWERIFFDVAVAPEATTLVTDAAKLHDIARNLIENAVNYTPDGGAIEVKAARRDSFFQLTVADTGHGIAPDDLPRVFERFYRVDKARTG